MKHLIYLSFLLVFICSFTNMQEQDEQDKIQWNPTLKLSWEDFKGMPNIKSSYKAMTYVQIDLNSNEFDDSIVIDVPTYFFKKMSWSKSKSEKLLSHEQLHFDIAELVARRIRKEYLAFEYLNLNDTYEQFQTIYHYNYKVYMDSINKKYDIETNHSINKEKQKEWEAKIAKELKALDKYSSTKVVIKRVKE